MRHWKRVVRKIAFASIAFTCTAPLAGNVGMTGSFGIGDPGGRFFRVTFSCFGAPTCNGVFTVAERDGGCSNAFSFSGSFMMTGIDLSLPGTFGGAWTISADSRSNPNSDGTCSYRVVGGIAGYTYTASWDGTSGTLSFTVPNGHGGTATVSGTFTATGIAPPPSFPMTVTANVTPTNANVSAQIQPRPQDVGTTQSIFVFAYAPLSIASKRLPWSGEIPAHLQDGPDPCVLAQVNSNGQLVAASASTMQPYTTGVLTSQGAAVTILNNVPTPNVAGATMYVGYGTSAGSMLGNGNYQGAVNIPGAAQCTTNLATAAAPTVPGALSGVWYNASESGWGIHFTQRGPNIFAAWYTYDSAGKPKWYVISNCTGFTGASGTCNGPLYDVTGPSFFTGSFNSALVNATSAGTSQVTFRDANNATLTYTVAGQTRTVAIVRQPLATGTTPPAVDYTDIWWNPSESGWGMAMSQQYGINFLAWYVYDTNGKPTWQVATCVMSGSSCSGTLYRTTGPPFGPTFNPGLVQATAAGTITVNFTDANNAILNYTVDGVSATKTITRQLF